MKYNVFDLKLNEDIIQELNKAKKVEIYLINERARAVSEYRDTFLCTMVYLKTDDNQYFRISGIEEDFGSRQDEVFGIKIQKNWKSYEVKNQGDSIIFKDEPLRDTTHLYLYDVFKKDDDSNIKVNSYIDLFEEVYPVEVDDGILFRRENGNQCIYIGLDNAPVEMVVTKDRRYIKKLMG